MKNVMFMALLSLSIFGGKIEVLTSQGIVPKNEMNLILEGIELNREEIRELTLKMNKSSQMNLVEYSSVGLNIILALAAIITSYTAVKGINSWRKQHIGQKKIGIAKEVLELVYRISYEFHIVRSPFISGNEYPKEYIEKYQPSFMTGIPKQEKDEATIFVYNNRIKELVKCFDELKSKTFELRIYIDENYQKLLQEYWKLFIELKFNIENVIFFYGPGTQEYKEASKIVHSSKDDDFSKQIAEIVKKYEELLKYVREN